MPLSMVATLVVAYYNIAFQHAELQNDKHALNWYARAREIAEGHLNEEHGITRLFLSPYLLISLSPYLLA